MKLSEYVGQTTTKRLLKPEIQAARRSGGVCRHILLEGPYGVGKTALAGCLATELSAELVEMPDARGLTSKRLHDFFYDLSVQVIEQGWYTRDGRPTPTAKPYVLIVDEIHNAKEFECWFEPLERFHITIMGQPSWVPYFTLVACTTYPEELPLPFLSRLPLRFRLETYTEADLVKIIRTHDASIGEDIAKAAARRARGVARYAINFAISARNFGDPEEYFEVSGIDERGLNDLDRRYLSALSEYPQAVGIQTLAARLGAEAATLRGTVEPYLVRLGLIEITERGRKAAQVGLGSRNTVAW